MSNTLEAGFCAEALTEALARARPEVFNTDQSLPREVWGQPVHQRRVIQVLQDHAVKICMGGKGRYADNIFVQRLWRTGKYEEVYPEAYANAVEARRELESYFRFYDDLRPHLNPGLPDLGQSVPRGAGSPGSLGRL